MSVSGFTQENRMLTLLTPLGPDVLLLNSFSVSERISAPFIMELDVMFEEEPDWKSLLRKPISISVGYADGGNPRSFHGIVTDIGIGGQTERFKHARIVARPSLWFLTQAVHFRAFEKMTVPDIVKNILSGYGFSATWRVTGTYTEWDYCCQYKETDFNFISRLLEHEGISYYFNHSTDGHELIMVDSPDGFAAGGATVNLEYIEGVGPGDNEHMTAWDYSYAYRTGKVGAWDWNYLRASGPVQADVKTTNAIEGNDSLEVWDYPGRYSQQFNTDGTVGRMVAESDKTFKKRIEEIEAENPYWRGSSNCRSFSAGHRFTLRGDHFDGAKTVQSAEYVVRSIDHIGCQYPPYVTDFRSAVAYSNTVVCFKHGTNYRPPRVAQRSYVPGPQTAIVTDGPDLHARMKVTFHWGPKSLSAWVRVAQRWAGPGWGSIFLPRPGHEVIIEFLDGDPDHPLIVGSVYNSTNKPPYPLPGNYSQSGVKTRSMVGKGGDGGTDEFNELRFEDKQGSEDIYFHAQKDFHRFVENDDDLIVKHDQTIEIENHRTETVKKGNEKVTIEKGHREIYVDTGNDKHQVKKGNREAIIDMGNDSIRIKMGNHMRKIDLGKSETEAMQSIELKVGQSSVKLDQAGVTIKGAMIKFEALAMIQSKAPMQQHKADALMIIKGGLTMIN